MNIFKTRGLFLVLAVALTGCVTPPAQDFRKAMAAIAQPSATDARPVFLAPAPQPPADISSDIETILTRHAIPGAVAVVLRGQTIIAEGAAGVRKRGSPEKVTLADRFEIASSAKSISALVIARLVDQGMLTWDRSVASYFPEEKLSPSWQRVTLRELLSHTAGLKDPWFSFLLSAYTNHGSLRDQRAAFARKILHRGPAHEPGVRVAYTNVDYILAAVIAERATGENWETLVHREVFVPLGLRSAGFGPPGEKSALSEPRGHGKLRVLQLGVLGNFAFDPESRGADYPAMASPAGFVHLAARDWAAYVAVQLRAHQLNPNREIRVWTPPMFAPLHEMKSDFGYAGGWFVETRGWAKGPRATDTGRVLFHPGENGRWTSAVWMAPERDFAVLVACNQGNASRGVDAIAEMLVRRFAAE